MTQPARRILLVKTSSLGDVVHNFPVVSDIAQHLPGATVDWVVEERFAALPALHPGVGRVLPVAIRRWRRRLTDAAVRDEVGAFLRRLRAERYDVVIDTQGLMKTAWITRAARGTRCGFDWGSVREPLASLACERRFAVSRSLHAVVRNRTLAGLALGYAPDDRVDYGIRSAPLQAAWLPGGAYAVLLHSTSRQDKEWPEQKWVDLGMRLADAGLLPVLPAGSPQERARSERLRERVGAAVVPPALGLDEAAALLAGARGVVGVDTGLTHLAAALGVRVAAIYTATDPAATGVLAGPAAINVGGIGAMPSVDEVWQALGMRTCPAYP